MKEGTKTTQQVGTKTDAAYEASKFAMTVGTGVAIMFGLWGLSCFIGGMATHGLGGLLRGIVIAVTGS